MTLTAISSVICILVAIGLVVTARKVARLGAEDLRKFGHSHEHLQAVLAGRYVPMAIFTLAAALSQNLLVIGLSVFALAVAAFIDFLIYYQDAPLRRPHIVVAIVFLVAAIAVFTFHFGAA